MIAGTTYNFKVAAINSIGNSSATSVFAISTLPLTFPDPPTALTETTASITFTEVAFTWSDPLNNGGSAITGFKIQWDQGTGTWVQLVASQTANSFTLTGLTAGTTYNFTVTAINSIGNSSATSVFAISTLPLTCPDPPTDLTETIASKTFT